MKEEFKRQFNRYNKLTQPVPSKSRLLIKLSELPQEIRDFLEASKNRYPTIATQNGSVYVGEMVNGQQMGFGFCQAPNKTYYFGNWKDGLRHGEGTYCQENGTIYQGNWVDDWLTGQGKCRKPNGTYYEGEWLNNLHHGKGK